VRVALDFTSPEFAAAWSHPAVAAKQMAYWPNGGKVYSYHHAQEIITEVGNALAKANRVTDATPCTEVADIDGTAHRTDGLPKGAYACYHPKTYSWCDAHDDVHSAKYVAGLGGLGYLAGDTVAAAQGAARTFTDDAGVTHTTRGQPTFITDVQDALSLVHYGVHHQQVHATYGSRFQSGSNGRIDGTPMYANGNQATFGVDHNVADYDPSLFPVDPNAMEMAALAQAPNLSPGCIAGGAFWCTEFDMSPANATAGTPAGPAKVILDDIGWPDFLIAGAAAYAQYYAHNAEVNAAAEAAGTKTILITRADPATGLTRGLVEMAEKYEELATFLGADAAGRLVPNVACLWYY
jgi:hypothetical protein